MRNRTSFIFLFALILAMVPLVQMNQSQTRCEVRNGVADDSGVVGLFGFSSSDDKTDPCANVAPAIPAWASGAGFLSAACFGACIFSGIKTWRERRREQELFRSVGADPRANRSKRRT